MFSRSLRGLYEYLCFSIIFSQLLLKEATNVQAWSVTLKPLFVFSLAKGGIILIPFVVYLKYNKLSVLTILVLDEKSRK